MRFENDVKMYGTQTACSALAWAVPFENDVKMYGTQTEPFGYGRHKSFENDVKMYGTQTITSFSSLPYCLRMM